MNLFQSVLVPLAGDSPWARAERALADGLALARWFRAGLQSVIYGSDVALAEALKSRIEDTFRAPSEVVPNLSDAFSPAVAQPLVCLRARGGEELPFVHEELRFAGECESPTLLFPHSWPRHWSRRKMTALRDPVRPPKSIVVPVSGRRRHNEAIVYGLKIANELGACVDLLHVVGHAEARDVADPFLELYSDQFHHEYPALLRDFVAQASPYSTSRERRWIRSFSRSEGDVPDEVIKLAATHGRSIVILEWRGTLTPGRIRVLRRAFQASGVPVLLVRADGKCESRLRIGDTFQAA